MERTKRKKKTDPVPFITQSGMCVCVCVREMWCVPLRIGIKMGMPKCVCVFKTCASGCVCVFGDQCAHVSTCAYLCGRMGPAFDKRGSVCPVVKYGDER